MTRNWSEEDKQWIIDSYINQGLTCSEISRKYGAKPNTISKYLKLWGVEIKGNLSKNRLLKEDYFDKIDTPEKAYFLGLLLADGSVILDAIRNPNIQLELVETDVDMLYRFRDALNSNAGFYYNKRRNRANGTYRLSFRSKKIAEALEKFNIIPNKTYETKEVIFPDKYKIDFIRGYVDGDGSIYFSNGHWHINITGHCKEIINQFRLEISRLINISHIPKMQCSNGVYRMTWNGIYAVAIIQKLYNNSTISLARKHAKAMAAQEDKRVEDIV